MNVIKDSCSLKIKDVKEITLFVKEAFDIDLSGYAYVSLKIKLEQFCQKYGIYNVSMLFDKLDANIGLQDEFLSFIYLNEFELFRDPSLWRCIREDILKSIKTDTKFKVWFPSSSEGAELISFLILRDELKLTEKIQVIYTTELNILDQAKAGFPYEERKHSLNLSNYKRIDGRELSDKYFTKHLNKLLPSLDLFKNTVQEEFNEINSVYSKSVNMIIYRNKLLILNRKYQVGVVGNLIKSLKTGGFLVLGVKERLVDDENRELFSIFNLKESVYKKKS